MRVIFSRTMNQNDEDSYKEHFETVELSRCCREVIYRILKDECNDDLAVNIFRHKDTKILEHSAQLAELVSSELATNYKDKCINNLGDVKMLKAMPAFWEYQSVSSRHT